MNENQVYAFCDRMRVVSGSGLKVLAMASMIVDHIASSLLRHNEVFTHYFLTWGHHGGLSWYMLMRYVGRLAFPIFAFLLVEGFYHTHDKRKYGLNLLIFALLSELPWDLLHTGNWFGWGQNVFFTLFLGYLGLCTMEMVADYRKYIILLVMLGISVLMHADYGCAGFALIIMMYVLRDQRVLQAIIGCGILPMHWIAGLAFIPINMYNGERGFVKHQWSKYLFYIIYPAHLLILYWIKYKMPGA